MAVTLSIKDVSDELAEALRERARRNHRSIQGELTAILEQHLLQKPFHAHGLLARVMALGLSTTDEATAIVRADRDRR